MKNDILYNMFTFVLKLTLFKYDLLVEHFYKNLILLSWLSKVVFISR